MFLMPFYAGGPFELRFSGIDFYTLYMYFHCVQRLTLSCLLHVLFGKLWKIFKYVYVPHISKISKNKYGTYNFKNVCRNNYKTGTCNKKLRVTVICHNLGHSSEYLEEKQSTR